MYRVLYNQTKNTSSSAIPCAVHESPFSRGQPLDSAEYTCTEPLFGHGIGQVRTHKDVQAVESPRAMHSLSMVSRALAFSGQPLDTATRAFMEPRFGYDFSRVRVHTGATATEATQATSAHTFTVGPALVFGARAGAPSTTAGRRLLAHELAHVVQQQAARLPLSKKPVLSQSSQPSEIEADQAADAVLAGRPFNVTQSVKNTISRTQLNVTQIKQDIDDGSGTPVQLFSWLHVIGERSGEIGRSAAPPGQQSLPIEAVFFPSYRRHHDRRALVLGGFHGNERPGIEIADELVTELRSGTGSLASGLNYHTLVVPHVNPWGIAHNNRCNANRVDLNRNLPVPGASTSSPVCTNTATAPTQPETQAVADTIRAFQPNRILSTHSIGNAVKAGVYADPSSDPTARRLACSMAGRIVDPNNRQGNRLTPTSCNPVYPGPATGGRSLGAYGPTRSITGQTIPVITLEAPEHRSLSAPGRPSVGEFMPAVEEFLQ